MDPRLVRELLERVRAGEAPIDEAMDALRELPFRDLGFATVDHHRGLRQGVPEVIFGEHKTIDQLAGIAEELVRARENVLITRIGPDKGAALASRLPGFRYAAEARVGAIEVTPVAPRPCAPIAVVSAGTSDQPVAEEAVETLRAVGLEPQRFYDVGVAGIHRLLHRAGELKKAGALIVVAGMEGALPSVVGGLCAAPIVAVPTSIGYGAALGGFTALLGMLTSCAAGVVVVNIDNGFGAAMAVHRMMPK
jgi:pyridinium-3,5-biscarboxylic acid mononucleotide synthase